MTSLATTSCSVVSSNGATRLNEEKHRPESGEGGDDELLGRFIERRDEAALAALVNRHGPMVWGVCRRRLSHHDAEDAFQATFIVLARKASSLAHRETVGNWLYGVAHQTALQARRTAGRRREVQGEMPDVEAPQDQWADVRPILDEELSRLPDHYRAVIVLCELEGRTRKEVARQFSCPEGTVASRLARAKAMLAKRLTARGVALSVGALVLSHNVSAVPAAVASSTIKAASLCGKAAVSLKVAALTEGVLKAMLVTKLKAAVAVVLVLGFLAVGAIGFGIASGQTKDDAPQTSEKAQKVEDVKEKAEAVAWGKEVDGLQVGLALVPADAQTFRQGETVKFAVKLRNVGKAEITATCSVLRENAAQITTDAGGPVSVYMPPPFDYYAAPTKRILKPGETITLYNPEIAVESEARARLDGEMRVDTPTICVAPGKYKIAFGGMIQGHPKLISGTVEIEVKNQVAWGKEVKGLQMGLVLTDSRSYEPGAKVKMEVMVRNVSKAPVTITYGLLQESAPQITYPKGGEVNVQMPPINLFIVIPTEEVIGPGKTVTLYRPEFAVEAPELGPVTGPVPLVSTPTIRVQPGKYQIGYSGMVHSHPKLATGAVEFEVKEPAKPVEAFTEWGKESGGLQAGLGYKAGEKRAYSHGETVTMVVRVRNVSKKMIEFQYLREFFLEAPPAVTDGDGKPVRLPGSAVSGRIHLPEDVSLAPGKEIVLYEMKRELRPAKWLGNDGVPSLYGKGKFQIQYKRVFGNSTSGAIKVDPALSKLATGKLELEVKEASPPAPADEQGRERKSAYATADIVVQYRDETGREVRDLQQFRVEDADTVAKLASHFPGILGDRGSGPRTSAGKRATFTIKFNHKSGEASQSRVAHITADYATWLWRDNTPYTGDRQVEDKDKLQSLMDRLAAKNKVDLK